MWTFRNLEIVPQDLRFAGRTLRKNPGFTLGAVLTLALGIGANTAIFSVVDAVILRPLPYADSDRLVELWGNVKRAKVERRGASFPDYSDWRRESRSFEGMALMTDTNMTVTSATEPERISVDVVSQPYFDLLGARAAVGRTFRPEEDAVPQRDAVVVISDGLWKRRFGGDRSAIGRSIQLNGTNYQIIGVMPSWFRGLADQTDLWMPLMMVGSAQDFAQRGNRGPAVLAKLKPGVTLPQAQMELDAISRNLERAYPATNEGRAVEVSPLTTELFGSLKKPLLVLLCAVGFVLLIACTNVANLTLARGEARRQEIAMRIALGASRWRVLSQLAIEGYVLAAIGATAGLLAARWGVQLLLNSSPVILPSFARPAADSRVALFAILITCVCALAVGLTPVSQVRSGGLIDSLRAASTRASATRGGRRFRSVLVAAEVAFAMLLLVGAGLMIRTLQRLAAIDPGYDTQHVLTMRVALPRTGATASELVSRTRALHSVVGAAAGSDVPLVGSSAIFYEAEGQAPTTAQNRPRAYVHRVSADFFRTFEIRFVAGRTFSDVEMHEDRNVVVVSESVTRRFWPGQDPIGKRIRGSSDGPWQTIIGVVNEMKYRALPRNPTNDPDLFWPFNDRQRNFALFVRTPRDPASLAPAVRGMVREQEPSAVVFNVNTMAALAASETAESRFTGWLMGVFAAAALALATVGIYGVMSYMVSRRTQEIGIRLALGAARSEVMAMVLRSGMALAGLGLVIGVAAAAAMTRWIETLLYEVHPADPIAYLLAAFVLAAVAFAACVIPAARATRIPPAVALRNE
jgi:predicted permease